MSLRLGMIVFNLEVMFYVIKTFSNADVWILVKNNELI
jgi:hypothetical protein